MTTLIEMIPSNSIQACIIEFLNAVLNVERVKKPGTPSSFRLLDSIIDEILSRHIIIKIPKTANETRERDPEILAFGAMLANVEINGPTIQFGHVIGRDVIDTSLLNLVAK